MPKDISTILGMKQVYMSVCRTIKKLSHA